MSKLEFITPVLCFVLLIAGCKDKPDQKGDAENKQKITKGRAEEVAGLLQNNQFKIKITK